MAINKDRYYLLTTNLKQNQLSHLPDILLGDWCSKDIDYDSDISIWRDREYYSKFSDQVNYLYEMFLDALARYLNNYHGEQYDTQYWRIITGPWLYRFICAFVDRYLHIKNVSERYQGMVTHKLNYSDYRTPFDTRTFRILIQSHLYNLQLISDIIPFFNIRTEIMAFQGRTTDLYYRTLIRNQKTNETKGLYFYTGAKGEEIYIRGSLISQIDMVASQYRFIDYDTTYPSKLFSPSSQYDKYVEQKGMVAQLEGIESDDPMMHILSLLLPKYIPLLYTQYYQEFLAQIQCYKADCIVNDFWHEDETIKFIAAQIKARKGKIIAVNPGGMMGGLASEFVQVHERTIADEYLNQGPYKGCEVNNILPIKKRQNIRKSGERILYISAGFHQPYVADWHSIPCGNTQIHKYYSDQMQCILNLSPEIRSLLQYRPHPRRENSVYTSLITSSGIKKCQCKSLWESISKSKLIIIDHVTSSFIDVLISERPFVLFWNEQYWNLTKEAEEFLRQLEKVGVFYNTPSEAANCINSIINNLDKWWNDVKKRELLSAIRKIVVRESRAPQRLIIRNINILVNKLK
ncbi:hypothetical protein JHL18_11735 [Clostridium sp. YIM B02505]|uniref:Transferase n=1 Tax=Clostridium yunnanense TaxID=2800325 RepID=A0ABS1EPG1_9CLOT|nr:LIC12162 family protein [Clostridium yunnanense]MBK1811297.1 hypothetical protein [Clostridium yunnanense]